MPLSLTPNGIKNYTTQRPKDACGSLCLAPQRSLYFGFRGNVSSCCFNKTHVLGRYPEQSLLEIWNGEQRHALDEALKKNDFSKGCHGCHDLINSGNFANLPAKNFDHLLASDKGFPTKVDFELSNECNLECTMCRGEFSSAIRKNREDLPPIPSPYDHEFIRQLEAFIPHIEHSHFLGGEPFLIPIYLDIWEKMMQLNPSIRISVQTNATILSDRVKRILETMVFDIAVSIDSFEKETYESIRKNAVYEKVMENIQWFRAYCQRKGTKLTVSFCPMTGNWKELPKVVKHCNELDAKLFFNTVYFPKELSYTSLSASELKEIITYLEGHDLPASNQIEHWNRDCLEGLIGQLHGWSAKAQEGPAATGDSTSILNYIAGLEAYIISKAQGSETEKMELATACLQKLEFVLSEAEKHGLRNTAEQKLMEVAYETMFQSLPETPMEHLLYLFKSFMVPMPD